MRAAYPWIEQTNLLFGKNELGETAPLAQSTIENFAKTQAASQELLPQLDNISKCWNKNWFPTSTPSSQTEPTPPARRTTRSSGTRWSA